MGGGGALKMRPEGYHREVSQLQRLHDKLRLDAGRDARARSRICAAISAAIAELNALADQEIAIAPAAPAESGGRARKTNGRAHS